VDYRALVVLIVKTAGLILVLYTIALLPGRIGGYVLEPERSNALFVWWVLAPFLLPLAVGLFMWWFPASSARSVVGAPFAGGGEIERLVQPLVFSGIGLFLVLDGIETLAYYFALSAYMKEAYAGGALEDPSARADVASNIVSVVIGVVLILGGRGLSALLYRLRHGSSHGV
jgi:hypothetical protein